MAESMNPAALLQAVYDLQDQINAAGAYGRVDVSDVLATAEALIPPGTTGATGP